MHTLYISKCLNMYIIIMHHTVCHMGPHSCGDCGSVVLRLVLPIKVTV